MILSILTELKSLEVMGSLVTVSLDRGEAEADVEAVLCAHYFIVINSIHDLHLNTLDWDVFGLGKPVMC